MRYLTKKEKLSKVLIRERDRRGLSQQEVASAVGASLRNYQRWEGGKLSPNHIIGEGYRAFLENP